MKEILERLLAGDFTVDEALRALDVERVENVGGFARLDPERQRRKGVPEVVYAPGKSQEVLRQVVERMVEAGGSALVSRLDAGGLEAVEAEALKRGWTASRYGSGLRVAVVELPEPDPANCGKVGLLAAGSSDVLVAEEARMVMEAMGVMVGYAYDVGVAALHRLAGPLAGMTRVGADVFIVAAGMDAALPSVVAGLVDVPVVALPVSTGYGAGGRGLAALLATLQACSPGVAVVNIDNGVGAGAVAGLIARRMAAARGA